MKKEKIEKLNQILSKYHSMGDFHKRELLQKILYTITDGDDIFREIYEQIYFLEIEIVNEIYKIIAENIYGSASADNTLDKLENYKNA